MAHMSQPASETDKLLPQSVEAEVAFLGSMLIDPECLLLCTDFVRPEDFYRDAHKEIADAAWCLYHARQPIDLITLTDELERRGKLQEVGGGSYVSGLPNAVPTSAHAEYYAKIVADKARLRQIIHVAGQMAGLAYNQPDVDAALAAVRGLWHGVEAAVERSQISPGMQRAGAAMDTLLAEVLTRMAGHASRGITTGYRDLDAHLISIEPGELLYLAGRPGSGKTTIVQGIIAHNVRLCEALGTGTVDWVSLEMRREQVANHLVCALAGVNSKLWRNGFHKPTGQLMRGTYDRWKDAYDELYPMLDRRLYLHTGAVTMAQLRARLTRARDERDCRLVVLDYLGLVQPENRRHDERQRVSDLSRDLKRLAEELGLPVLCIVQMNRSADGRENKRPTMTDLRDSGQLEQDADFVLGCYRPAYYDKARAVSDEHFKRFTELLVLKAREGIGDQTVIPLRAELEYSRFREWPRNVPWPVDTSRGATPPHETSAPEPPTVGDQDSMTGEGEDWADVG